MPEGKGPRALLTPTEIAALLGVPRKTAYKHISNGLIPSVRLYSGKPRVEPLVALALREGVSSEKAHEVAAAVAQGAPEEDVLAIWRARSAEVIPIPTKKCQGGGDG